MRTILLAGGAVCALFGILSYRLNVAEVVRGQSWACRAGFCDLERLREEARVSGMSDDAGVRRRGEELTLEVLRLDLASPYAWMDAAAVLRGRGEARRAQAYFERAQALGRGLAPLQMHALNYVVGFESKAVILAEGKDVLRLTRAYDDLVFRYYRESGATGGEVLAQGLPEEEGAGNSWLQSVIGQRDLAGARAAWEWLQRRKLTSVRSADSYAGLLLQAGEVRSAFAHWSGARAGNGRREKGNGIYNPKFERPFEQGPFDWQVGECSGVDLQFEDSGSFSLRFRGEENVGYRHVRQLIPARAGRLVLRAKVKSEGLTTNEGVYLELRDAEHPERLKISSEKYTGTREWTELRMGIEVPAGTRLLELSIARDPSKKLENKIGGRFELSRLVLEEEAVK